MPGHGNLPRGMDLISHPGLNKGTAFTDAERAALGLHGILPPHVETLRRLHQCPISRRDSPAASCLWRVTSTA
jgi:hypothetical protein